MIPDFTTVVALDRPHADELLTVLPTWQKYKPELFTRQVLLIVDAHRETGFPMTECTEALKPIYDAWPAVLTCHWCWPYKMLDDPVSTEYTQRQRMLTALLTVPPTHVFTPYYLKLDTDVVATQAGAWIKEEWFDEQQEWHTFDVERPAIISSPWGYTKPPEAVNQLDLWAKENNLPGQPLYDFRNVRGSRFYRKRIISWLSFVRTDFAKAAINLFGQDAFEQASNLPVRSHDTVLWYLAERLWEPIVKVKMKGYGWDHVSGRRLKGAVEKALGGGYE